MKTIDMTTQDETFKMNDSETQKKIKTNFFNILFVGLLAAFSLFVLFVASYSAAYGDTTSDLEAANKAADEAQAAYEEAKTANDEAQAKLDEVNNRITELETQLPLLQQNADAAITSMYKSSDDWSNAFLLILTGSSSLDEVFTLINSYNKITTWQQQQIDALECSLTELSDARSEAETATVTANSTLEEANTKKQEAEEAQEAAEAAQEAADAETAASSSSSSVIFSESSTSSVYLDGDVETTLSQDYVESMRSKAASVGSSTGWVCLVDKANYYATFFRQSSDSSTWNLAYSTKISHGGNKTFSGVWKVDHKAPALSQNGSNQYWVCYYPYYESGPSTEIYIEGKGYEGGQGFHYGPITSTSHGCVRVGPTLASAKWVYDNITVGSTVYIF